MYLQVAFGFQTTAIESNVKSKINYSLCLLFSSIKGVHHSMDRAASLYVFLNATYQILKSIAAMQK